MSKMEYLIFPWDGFKNARNVFKTGWYKYLSKQINHIQLDMGTRRYDYIKEGERIGPKCVQSLEYVLTHWPNKRAKKIVVQAGGCLGLWPKILSTQFDWVYTFEPQAQAFFFLSLNCPEDNVIKMQMALGSDSSPISVEMTNRPGRGKVTSQGFIPMTAIDHLKLSACDAILLDTEGYELNILQGAVHTINQFRPIILCEDWENESIDDFMILIDYEFVIKVNKDNIYKPKESGWNA